MVVSLFLAKRFRPDRKPVLQAVYHPDATDQCLGAGELSPDPVSYGNPGGEGIGVGVITSVIGFIKTVVDVIVIIRGSSDPETTRFRGGAEGVAGAPRGCLILLTGCPDLRQQDQVAGKWARSEAALQSGHDDATVLPRSRDGRPDHATCLRRERRGSDAGQDRLPGP